MSEGLFAFEDPVTVVYQHVAGLDVGRVEREEPDDWNRDQLLILLKDAGGDGVFAHQWQDARVTVEVRHRSHSAAADAASYLESAIRAMEYEVHGLRYLGATSRPTYWPLAEERIPAYTWTVLLRIKGHPA